MLKIYLFCSIFCYFSLASAQFSDDFSDGDFTANPVWTGSPGLFTIDNFQLRSNSPGASVYYISTPSTQATESQWEFTFNLKFATSGSNYVRVFLMSDNTDLGLTQNGYFIQIGNTTDEISLYKVVGGTASMIIDGVDGLVNSSTNNPFRIKVRRDVNDLWTLEYDKGITGTFSSGGSVTDNSVNTSAFFGIAIVQSSAGTVVNNHFFDDIWVGDIVLDLTPPTVLTASTTSNNQLDVLFNEGLDQTSAENVINYSVDQSIGNPTSAILDGTNPALVHLTFATTFTNTQNYVLTTHDINDLSLNPSVLQQTPFTYIVGQIPSAGDIIINEFMADPSPVIGLPEIEFVEIYNKSNKVFHLKNWKLSDNSTSGTLGDSWLLPNQYLILVPSGGDTLYSTVCVVSNFASLNNSGDDIKLQDTSGLLIDKLTYTSNWYHDNTKKDGGYTIERINPNHPCSGIDNWRASENSAGGTPNTQNSVYNTTADIAAPELMSVFADSVNWVTIQFSEELDSLDLINVQINFNPAFTIISRMVSSARSSMMKVQVLGNFETGIDYQISILNISDCWGNTSNLSGNFILPSEALVGDLIINEILFDPLTGASDYVELFNNSSKTFNLKNWSLATYTDSVNGLKTITTANYFVKPGQYVLVTKDSMQVKQIYPNYGWGTFIAADVPSYANDKGFVYLVNSLKTTIDHVDYTDKWHFKLLETTDGKALERINPSGVSNDPSNWNTASENVSFGTPGIRNSQYLVNSVKGAISISPKTFSPDNDGFEDFTLFNYQLPETGMVGNIVIYDEMGRVVRQLVNNYYFDTEGFIKWDGVTDDQSKAPVGRYIVLFDIHSITTDTKLKDKQVVIISSKINQ